jgi:hypothetical protein
MFEAIISQVRTGRIERKSFATMSEAEQYISRKQNKLINRKRNGVPRPVSLGDYRMEVVFRACAEIRQVLAEAKAKAA